MNSTIKRTLEVLKNDNWWRETTSNKFLVKTGLDLIEEALTPPTSEEVCEALSEEIHKKVLYNKDLEEFYYIKDISWRTNEEIMVCAMDFDKEKIVYYNSFGSKSTFLKPKTNILVGRFYEELERKENEKN